jgi:dienelactone hydrolase
MQEKVSIKNQRGLNLATVVHMPDGAVAGKFPAMILLHGFTGYKEEEHIVSLADELVQKGIMAIRFDASGFGESEGTIERDFRLSNYIQDADAVYQYVVSRPDVDARRIGIWGHSMGGMVAVITAAAHPAIKLACVISSPSRMGSSDKLSKAMPEWKRTGWYERESPRFGTLRIPYAFMEDAQKWNMFEYVPKVKAPLLVVWGTKDVNVRPEQTKEIFERAHQPKEAIEIPGMDHYYKNNKVILSQVNGAVAEFITKNM